MRTNHGSAGWYKPILKELEAIFEQRDLQFELIEKIDKFVALDEKLDVIFKKICLELGSIVKADNVEVFLVSEKEVISMDLSIVDKSNRLNFPMEQLSALHGLKNGEHIVLHPKKGSAFSGVLFPIFVLDKVFGVIVIAQKDHHFIAILESESFLSFGTIVSNHLGMMAERYFERRRLGIQTELIRLFFNSGLAPFACWNQIVAQTVNFLPDWHPLLITPDPKAQLLLYNEGDRHLRIVATQGKELVGTEVLVDSSICGSLIEDRSSDFILIDPNNRLERYKGFLLNEPKEVPHSELAVSIKLDERIVGVINLEHPGKDVFKLHHIEAIRSIASFLAPFIAALKSRYERQRTREIGLLYTMNKLLSRISATYQHNLGHPLLKARLTLEDINDIVNKLSLPIKGELDEVSRYLDEIYESSDRFCENLPLFVRYGPTDLMLTIKKAIAPYANEKFAEDEGIIFNLVAHGKIESVHASALLQEHIHNLIENSIYATREAIVLSKINKGQGRIDITVEPKLIKDQLGKKTASEIVVVRIEDNGTGCPIEHESNIGTPGFTTKAGYGSGYGLTAAKEYVQSLGGDLRRENKPGKGFIVEFHLEVFDPIKHKRNE